MPREDLILEQKRNKPCERYVLAFLETRESRIYSLFEYTEAMFYAHKNRTECYREWAGTLDFMDRSIVYFRRRKGPFTYMPTG
jgi:hypothetical protein